MSATPRPWTVARREPGPRGADGGYDIYDARNFPVLILPDGEVNKQKAYDIVRAVNLLDVMEEAKAALKGLLEYANENNQVSDDLISYAETVLAKLEKPS